MPYGPLNHETPHAQAHRGSDLLHWHLYILGSILKFKNARSRFYVFFHSLLLITLIIYGIITLITKISQNVIFCEMIGNILCQLIHQDSRGQGGRQEGSFLRRNPS